MEPTPAPARPHSPVLQVLDVPLTVKIRTGVQEKMNVAHKLIPRLREWGAALVTVQGSLLWCLGSSASMSQSTMGG